MLQETVLQDLLTQAIVMKALHQQHLNMFSFH